MKTVPISSLSLTHMNWPLGFPTVLKLNKNLALGTSLRLIYSSLASGTTVSQQKVNPGSSVGVDLAYCIKPILLS